MPTAGEKSSANSRREENQRAARGKAADVQQVQYQLKRGEAVTTIPTIDFNVETVEYKNLSFTVQKDTELIHREVKRRTKITCYLKEDQSESSEERRLKDLVKTHSERQPSRQLRSSDSESPEDRDDPTGAVQCLRS